MTFSEFMPRVCYHHDGEAHEHTHTHAHSHDGVEHTHEHTHTHTHEGGDHTHTHEGDHGTHEHSHDCAHECGSCAGCDPMQETLALMQYMVNHNAAHANELAELAKKLSDMGDKTAYEQVMLAVSDFEKGNLRLSTILAAMQ